MQPWYAAMLPNNAIHFIFYFTLNYTELKDFKNVSIVANYIKERTKNAQFVIISLR